MTTNEKIMAVLQIWKTARETDDKELLFALSSVLRYLDGVDKAELEMASVTYEDVL